MFTLEDAKKVIDKEISWCEQNQDNALSQDYRTGFVDGLIQAKRLIDSLRSEREKRW